MHALTNGEFTESPSQTLLREVGYGAGKKPLDSTPNLLRAVVGEIQKPTEEVCLLEANLDDVSGEVLGAAIENLIRAGALDAWLEPITMKRGRGAYKICALSPVALRDGISRKIMLETGTLGVRHRLVERTVAERRFVEVELPHGKCRVKIGSLDGKDYVASPEYADAARISEKSGVPLARVYEEVWFALAGQRPEDFSPGLLHR